MDDKERQAREAVRRARKNLPWAFSRAGNRQFFRRRFETLDVKILVALAREGDADAMEFLRRYGCGARAQGHVVPRDFHEFVWECFLDGEPKAKTGYSPKDTELRDQTIALLVKIVHQNYGFDIYRNVEHRGEKGSHPCATSIIAEELGLSERRVEEIWEDRKDSVLGPR
jgi:hypothetical protein